MDNMKIILLVLVSLVVVANATLTISNTLGSNMVLQRAPQQAQLWGTADANDVVTIVFNNMNYTATADANGDWIISLPATSAGGPYVISISAASGENIQMTNVLFGDVYICSGQSNMQFTVDMAFNASYEVQRANNYPNIRVFSVGTHTISGTPLDELAQTDLTWEVASSSNVGNGNWTYMSAVCWFTGADLYDQLNIPIGLISTNWGGTYIQAWSSPDALAVCNVPVTTFNASNGPNQPTALYNSMIYPFLQMSIGGALWYQGEQNVGEAALYACMEPAMIADWRSKFGNGYKFPFFFVQLAPWIGDVSYSVAVADMRVAQLAGLTEPYVGYASAIDLGDPVSPFNPIHPRNKQEVGARLTSAIMNIAYGKTSTVWEGPTFVNASYTVISEQVTVSVTFTTYGSSGLFYRPAVCPSQVPSNQCENWEVSFSDGNWYPTTTAVSSTSSNIVNVSIAVPSASLTPTGIRYAYSIWPLTTLFSAEGLPAISFTTTF